MKPTSDEKLFDYLSDVDDQLLNEAMDINSAEKLPGRTKIVLFLQKPAFRRTAVIAACLAVLLCILPLVDLLDNSEFLESDVPIGVTYAGSLDTPPVLYDPTEPSSTTSPSIPIESLDPPWENVGTDLSIESADMLNYYSAIYLLSRQSTGTGASSSYGLSLLDSFDNTEPPEGNVPVDETTGTDDIPIYSTPPDTDETEPPANTEGPPVDPPVDPTIPPDAEIYYYHFDPDATFHLSKVIFFRIHLTGDGFLAQTLGTGIVDVVITDISISNIGVSEPLITLRNGDKYLSFLLNGGNDTFFEFSTHKYIEGFSIVKNFRQENYAIVVTLDGNMQVDHFECQIFDYGNNPDGIVSVVGETYITEADLTFTTDELETYFRTVEIPQ